MTNVALRTLNNLALCAGVGMLDEGARLACEHLGLGFRTVCYVEREAAAASQLVTLMEAGCIDQAPIWSDLCTFDTQRWRGCVDSITAGFPCQPHSVAGKREGLEDERWIWPEITGLIGDLRPHFVWLENVPGLASTGGLDACIADLAARGYSAEWARLSAAAVGASHERERLFIFAWLADTKLPQRRAHAAGGIRCDEGSDAGREASGGARDGDGVLADPSGARSQGRELSGTRDGNGGGSQAHGSASELCGAFAPGPSDPRWPAILRIAPFLAPAIAAGSQRVWWNDATRSFVTETTEPGLCGLADGLALVVDESRTDQLRAVGNGVVALTAACAYVELVRRAGCFDVTYPSTNHLE